jgi:hypothetical protein
MRVEAAIVHDHVAFACARQAAGVVKRDVIMR